MQYESWTRTTARNVGPLGLVLKGGSWYLVALIGERPSTLRVSNIREAHLLEKEEPVARPKGFDLAAYWAESMQRFERELYKGEAVVLGTAAGLKALSNLGSRQAQAVAAAPASRRKDGRVRLRIPIESIAHAAGQLLRLAPEVEVLEPPALRAALVARLRDIVGLYGKQGQEEA